MAACPTYGHYLTLLTSPVLGLLWVTGSRSPGGTGGPKDRRSGQVDGKEEPKDVKKSQE